VRRLRPAPALVAAALALVAFGAAVTNAPFASSVLAIVSMPIALLAAATSMQRTLVTVALAAFAADLAVVAYWVYELVAAIRTSR
jgi:hypothetical protein